jgi:hypothetical protein
MRLEAGEIVGDYRVLEPLGVGGAGQVFRVERWSPAVRKR